MRVDTATSVRRVASVNRVVSVILTSVVILLVVTVDNRSPVDLQIAIANFCLRKFSTLYAPDFCLLLKDVGLFNFFVFYRFCLIFNAVREYVRE